MRDDVTVRVDVLERVLVSVDVFDSDAVSVLVELNVRVLLRVCDRVLV